MLLLLATAGAQTATAIVAGQSVGTIRIGGNVDDAIAALGSLFDQEDTASGKFTEYDWPLRPFLIYVEKESGRIAMIIVQLSDIYRTDKGSIAAGSERQTVEAAYGSQGAIEDNPALTRIVYDSSGIGFVLAKRGVMNGRVVIVAVFAPGQWKATTEGL